MVPVGFRHPRHVVVLFLVTGHEVHHHVPVFRPPLHAGFEIQVVCLEFFGRDDGPMSDPAAIDRRFRA